MAYIGNDAPILLGQNGIVSDLPPTQLPPGSLIDARNITAENGTLQKAPGSKKYNNVALSGSVIALKDWKPDVNNQRLIAATDDGKLFRDTGDGSFNGQTAIKSGLKGLTPNVFFVEGGQETAINPKKLFFLSANNQIQVLSGDGSSFSDISQPNSDWSAPNYPNVGAIHRARLWVFRGQATYASDTGDHENFQSNNLIFFIAPGEGGDIIGAYVYKGKLFAFKRGGFLYQLVDDATSTSNWYWAKVSETIGLASPHALATVTDSLIVGDDSGTVGAVIATDKLGQVELRDLSKSVGVERYLSNNTNRSGLPQQQFLYYKEKKQLFVTHRTGYKTANDMIFVWDFSQRDNVILTTRTKEQPVCLALRDDINRVPRPIYGDASGFIYLMDQEDRLEGGSSYEGSFQTKYEDFSQSGAGIGAKKKIFTSLTVEFIPEGNWPINIDYFIDGRFIETITVQMQVLDRYLNSFKLDKDRLQSFVTQKITKRLVGSGKSISFQVRNAGSNQSFQIVSLTVGSKLAAKRVTRGLDN